MKTSQQRDNWVATVTGWKSLVALTGCVLPTMFCSPGCANDGTATTRPTMDAAADNVIRDPMHYSPFDGKPDMSSGGDHLEHQSLQQDLNDVLHP
jgi:hypothetical protein